MAFTRSGDTEFNTEAGTEASGVMARKVPYSQFAAYGVTLILSQHILVRASGIK
ncbi:MAG: hypothetical protein IIC84_01960 [Chloroflexi bacterium]|nr:hypothetical protein [Chloroflexota bacterium]